jgi:uncharacterized protein YecE (DUF72 family)
VAARLCIGTSGWHYKHWLGVFYPSGTRSSDMLKFYTQTFNTVEVNNTFYQLPLAVTFDNWRETVPDGFQFAVKASRFITHMKKLKDPEVSSAKFFLGVQRLEDKLGPILFQLPPRWKLDLARLRVFLELLPEEWRYVLEFRDQSWMVPEVFELMSKHNIAFCIHDFADMKVQPQITADFTYIRFHGPTTAKYAGSYSPRQLHLWADRIGKWRTRLSAIYVYFNNDPDGAAVRNAITLKGLINDL